MSTKLYVGNLAFQTTNQDLQQLFGQAGTVHSASIIEDRDTGRSRGFAFVEMSSEEEATSAIAQFNGKEVSGRALKVNEAKPRENRGGGGRGFSDNRGGGYGGNGGRPRAALVTINTPRCFLRDDPDLSRRAALAVHSHHQADKERLTGSEDC